MAVSVMTWVWGHSRSRHGSRLVLLAIADSMGSEHGWAWPSVREISRKTALRERAVQTAISDLVKLGELEVGYNTGPKGCNRYRVLLSAPAESAPPQNLHPADSAPPQDLRGDESSQADNQNPADSAPPAENTGVQNSTLDPAESAPGTVREPKNSSTKSSYSPRKRATRIPDDFTVTPEMAQWARENVPELIRRGRGKRETDKFINYWQGKSGKDATKHDWPATWRNWMLKADDGLRSTGSHQNFGSRGGAADTLEDQQYGPGSTDI